MTLGTFRPGSSEKGQSLVEFAVILPILMVLLLGVLEFGWWLNGHTIITGAAREATRVAAMETEAAAEAAANNHVTGSPITNVNVGFSYGGDDVTVTVTGDLEPLIGLLVTGTIQLSGEAVMYYE
jgi:Flp pilus assembly protein TadG